MAFVPLDVLNPAQENKHKPLVLGIDLGTTNSLAALWRDGRPEVLRPHNGQGSVPSAIFFPERGEPIVGRAAREHALTDPQNVLFSVKRFMGRGLADAGGDLASVPFPVSETDRKLVQFEIRGKLWTPQELSALILTQVHANASRALEGPPISSAVITVPAYFDDAQRQATRDAARLAGLDVLRILNEPTAASLAYGLDRRKQGIVAVFDLGGGTFDLSVLSIEDGVFRVLSTSGDTHLGGDDFDRAFADEALQAMSPGLPEGLQQQAGFQQALRLAAERCKIALTTDPRAEFHVSYSEPAVHWRREYTREAFERLAEPLLERAFLCVRRALSDAKLDVAQIDEVVLVGGATRMPFLRRRVQEFFGRVPHTELDPDEVVALGAAVQGHVLAGGTRDILLMDVTPLSLGLETMGGAVAKVIQRNSPIPCQATEGFTTYVDNQTGLDFHIVQGEREMAKDCRTLARFKLRGIPPMPAGMARVAVRFQIDADGVLSVTAKEESTGLSTSIDVQPMHGMTDAEVERMLKESFANAQSDFDHRRLADLEVEIGTMTRHTRAHLDLARTQLDRESLRDIEDALQNAGRAIQAQDVTRLQEARNELERATMPLAALLMDRVAKEALKGKRLNEV